MKGNGYRFRPTDKFLIDLLQYKAAVGGNISGCTEVPGDVCELEMYGSGKEPWKVFSDGNEIRELHDSNHPDRKIKEKYVVTRLNKKGGKNVSRTAGNGSWDAQSKATPIMFDGHEMGHWRTLTYEYSGGDGAAEGKHYYYMNELQLSGTNYVVCRVLKNESKTCRIRDKKCHLRQENSAARVQDFPNTKRSRGVEKNTAFPHVQEQLIHPQEFQECNPIPSDYVYDPNFCGVEQDARNQEQHVASFDDPNIWGAVAQNQEQLDGSYCSDDLDGLRDC